MAVDILDLPVKGSVDAGDWFHIVDNADSLDKRIVIDDIRDYVLASESEAAAFATLAIGKASVSAYELEILDAAAAAYALVESGGAFDVGYRAKNTAGEWVASVNAGGDFILTDVTAGLIPLFIEEAAPTNSQHIAASGHVGWGRIPTAEFDHYRASEDVVMLIETGLVNGKAGLILQNDAQAWEIRVHTDDTFLLRNASSGIVPIIVEPGASDDTLFLDADGGVLFHTDTSLHPTLDTIESFGEWAIIGTDSNADNAAKQSRIGVTHYDIDEEPVLMIYGNPTATLNTVNIGGGSSAGNAATDIRFFTAADTITLGGTERLRIKSDGEITLAEAGDGDRVFRFASDASIAWDETEDHVLVDKPLLSAARSYESSSATENAIFDALDASIPNNNDKVIVTGGAFGSSSPLPVFTVSYAIRDTANVIRIYGIEHDTNAGPQFPPTYLSCTNGTGTAPVSSSSSAPFADISIAWG